MENRQLKYPTPAELYAIELNARRLRAAEMARILRSLTAALKSVVARAAAAPKVKGVRHA